MQRGGGSSWNRGRAARRASRVARTRFAAVLGLLGLALGCGPLALRLFDAGLARNLAADFVGELPDGLHVLLCGAGSPLPDPERSGPCTAVIAGRTVVVVDAGSGAARNLLRMGVPPGRIDAALLTHFHSDHIDGLGELATLRWVGAAWKSPLPLLGPPGVAEVAEGFSRAYAQDAGYRTAHHGVAVAPPQGAGLAPQPFDMPAKGSARVVLERDGLRVSAFRVDHRPVEPAVGYRFDYGGRSLVVSGDTKRSENLLAQARGVDVLVHEALSARLVGRMEAAAREAGNANLAKILSDIPSYHTTPVEAAELAARAGAHHLVFTHIVPALPVPGLSSVFLEGVSDAYDGDVTLGVDGTFVSLPSGSQQIRVGQR